MINVKLAVSTEIRSSVTALYENDENDLQISTFFVIFILRFIYFDPICNCLEFRARRLTAVLISRSSSRDVTWLGFPWELEIRALGQ